MKHINKFDSINEELFGIDLKKIKATALEYTSTKEYKSLLLSLDKSLLSSVANEINKIKNKWKSFDNFSKAVINKSQDTNESIVSSIILSVFGIHFTLKLLAALKNDWTFRKFLRRLVSSGKDFELPGIRDAIISIIFLIWVVVYTLFTNLWAQDYYRLRGNVCVDLPSSWNGFDNYDVRDDSGKEYIFRRVELEGKNAYIIEYKGENIGYFKGDNCIYDIQGNKILTDDDIDTEKDDVRIVKFDLENALMITPNKSKELDKLDSEIIKRDNEIRRLNKEITNIASDWGSETRQDSKFKKDSKKSGLEKPKKPFGLDFKKNEGMINENLALAKRLLREKGIDYDDKEDLDRLREIASRRASGKWFNNPPSHQELEDLGLVPPGVDWNEIIRGRYNIESTIRDKSAKYEIVTRFERIKDRLQRDNTIGYLGLLTKFLIGGSAEADITRVYNIIIRNRDIISNLRDSNYQKKDIFSFNTLRELKESLDKLDNWRFVNRMIRELPSQQKNLVWENGWFKIEDKKKIDHIITCLKELDGDYRKRDAFFAKISAVKSFDEFFSLLSKAARKEPWDFDFWTKKIENEKNAIITWSSKEEKQIICIVLTHGAINELAYSTSWCIVRSAETFARYKSKGYQCILFDFNYNASDSKSITGFTVNIDGRLTDCYDKYDGSIYMPSKFLVKNDRRSGHVDKKFIKISTRDILKRCEGNVIKYALAYIRIVLNKPLISKFIDLYDADE
jgi:hypothetical protein